MSTRTIIKLEGPALKAFGPNGPVKKGTVRALLMSARDASKKMRTEATDTVREKKAIKLKYVRRVVLEKRNKGRKIDDMSFGVRVRGDLVRASSYNFRAAKRAGGVSVEINKGQRTVIKGAFIARLKSGKKLLAIRRGSARLPIEEPFTSRPIDVLDTDKNKNRVKKAGLSAFRKTFDRVLDHEIDKAKDKAK